MVYDQKIVIADILRSRGIKAHYTGFSCLVIGIDYIINKKLVHKRFFLTKEIYPEIGKELGISWRNVERDIRTALEKADIFVPTGQFIKTMSIECYTEINRIMRTIH